MPGFSMGFHGLSPDVNPCGPAWTLRPGIPPGRLHPVRGKEHSRDMSRPKAAGDPLSGRTAEGESPPDAVDYVFGQTATAFRRQYPGWPSIIRGGELIRGGLILVPGSGPVALEEVPGSHAGPRLGEEKEKQSANGGGPNPRLDETRRVDPAASLPSGPRPCVWFELLRQTGDFVFSWTTLFR
jgi:hypothetical protein